MKTRSLAGASSRPPGVTLPEVLILIFLMGVVGFLMLQLLIPSIMLFRVESAATDAQQATFILVGRLNQALLNTELNTVTALYDPDLTVDVPAALAYQEVRQDNPYSPQGRPQFKDRFMVYYWNRTENKVYSEETPAQPPGHDWTDPQVPQRLSEAELRTLISDVNGKERVVARNIYAFELTDSDQDLALIHPPLAISVTARVEAPRGGDRKYEYYTMKTRVTPRLIGY